MSDAGCRQTRINLVLEDTESILVDVTAMRDRMKGVLARLRGAAPENAPDQQMQKCREGAIGGVEDNIVLIKTINDDMRMLLSELEDII